MVAFLRGRLGLDGPIVFTFLGRLISIVGSTGTVLLIVRFLNPVEQGYYYTLLSLVSLQLVFELGFSFVIQQLAAHESTHVELHRDGTVTGNAVAHARLASTLQLSLRWYTVAAVAMALILAPLGFVFFSHHQQGVVAVRWQGPWLAAACASAVGLWCLPFYAFLEGCGQVRAVAAMRLRQAIAASLLAWAAMLLHQGLYAPALVIVGQIVTGLHFLLQRRRFLAGLLDFPVGENTIHWSREVWPFQWRIAISWLCSYFTVQMFIPILFALRGAAEAGQMGMSLSITGYMAALALTWSSTKITPFGRLVAQREFDGLDRLFQRTLAQSLAVFAVMAICAMGLAEALPMFAARLSARIVSPPPFAVLILGAAAGCVVQSLATVLRCFKQEPFLAQSLIVALLTLSLGAATARQWGSAGAAFSYLIASAGVGLPIAIVIFIRARLTYLQIGHDVPCQSIEP